MSDCTVHLSSSTFLQDQAYRFCFYTNLEVDAYFFRIIQVKTKLEAKQYLLFQLTHTIIKSQNVKTI